MSRLDTFFLIHRYTRVTTDEEILTEILQPTEGDSTERPNADGDEPTSMTNFEPTVNKENETCEQAVNRIGEEDENHQVFQTNNTPLNKDISQWPTNVKS
ncbi:hypothetical protein JTE90_022681 [Oedothorax gibbosus]|uniref:Uncharacterized protein n=1 Tax=Oedothorax gibbosus TaxID=931172 RepID=A0AAV6ULS3_9ARAC|nr:hypothetical protein JTE90_022681 [Oedothorax gibbosus]